MTPGVPPPTLRDAVVLPMRDLLLRERGLLVLLFVILFKLPEVLAANMTLRFMLDIGISKFDIGAVRQGLGIAVTIIGAMAGGVLVAQLGLWRSLWVIGILGAVSNGGFLVLSQTGPVARRDDRCHLHRKLLRWNGDSGVCRVPHEPMQPGVFSDAVCRSLRCDAADGCDQRTTRWLFCESGGVVLVFCSKHRGGGTGTAALALVEQDWAGSKSWCY